MHLRLTPCFSPRSDPAAPQDPDPVPEPLELVEANENVGSTVVVETFAIQPVSMTAKYVALIALWPCLATRDTLHVEQQCLQRILR